MVIKGTHFGPLELEVLGLMESAHALSVADIQTRLQRRDRELAYTTVMTVLARLHEKGVVSREKSGRQFLYRAMRETDEARHGVIQRIHHALFKKSERLRPILNLLENDEQLTKDELIELKKLVEDKLQGRK
jgi:BlaI family transcriptional regulator, penicillinase repressor